MLHYNENGKRNQAETKAGEKRYSIMYPKYKSGGYIVKQITEKCTYRKLPLLVIVLCGQQSLSQLLGYVEDLYAQLWEVMQGKKKKKQVASPPPLCSQLERPKKEEAVDKHKSRFSKSS